MWCLEVFVGSMGLTGLGVDLVCGFLVLVCCVLVCADAGLVNSVVTRRCRFRFLWFCLLILVVMVVAAFGL